MKTILLSILCCTAIFLEAQVPSYLPTNGLVGWYPFSGNANDESGSGNNGVVSGATLTTDRFGNLNSAYNFNGITDYIMTQRSWITGINNNYTISFWIDLDSQSTSPTDKAIILHRADWSDKDIYWSNTPHSLVVSDRNDLPVSSITNIDIQNKIWTHVAFTSSDSILSVYINGIISQTSPRTTQSNWDTAYDGSFFGGNGYDNPWQGTFNGSLDDIGIWDRTLTSQEITALYTGNPTAIDDMATQLDMLTLYPNPVVSEMNITLSGNSYLSIKMFDEVGREVYARHLEEASQSQSLHISTNNLATGIYIMQVLGEQGAISKRVVVQK